MIVNGKQQQSIWHDNSTNKVFIIDQRALPFENKIVELKNEKDAYTAIADMLVRGAPLIGITAAFGLYLWVKQNTFNKDELTKVANYLKSARPTAINLAIDIDFVLHGLKQCNRNFNEKALELALLVNKIETEACSKIGDFGLPLIKDIWEKEKRTVNILTHCNAGWLACGDWGTATSPIYKAHQKGIPVHVWVDETRPRNQGARLTAWELQQSGVPYTVIPDNTGGHLMQHGKVDLVFVGSDRTTRNGDVANKIGTYLKALAAKDNNIPFYVALPSTTFDFTMTNGIKNIPIEQRGGDEVREMECLVKEEVEMAKLMPENTNVANYGFDVTPARLVSGLITERGICEANENSILSLFPEYK